MSQVLELDAVSILKRHGDAVNAYFASLRDRFVHSPPRLIEAIEYSLMASDCGQR